MTRAVTFVTGSRHKLESWQRIVGTKLDLATQAIDLEEIQSLDPQEIARHKLRQAYALVQKPVLVDDVSAGLDKLGGLPGPFIKFFEKQLGDGALYKLAHGEAPATVTCTVGYYDGVHELLISKSIHGTTVTPRGNQGFGFDKVFQPNGQTKTFAEMTPDQKDSISHRGMAVRELLEQLEQL